MIVNLNFPVASRFRIGTLQVAATGPERGHRGSRRSITLLLLGGFVCAKVWASESGVMADLDRICTLGQKAPESLYQSVFDRLGPQSTSLVPALMQKLARTDTGEPALGVYVWALGLCQDARAVPALTGLTDRARTEPLRKSCWKALTAIGGDASGRYLLAALDKTRTKPDRFDLLNLLAEMQYAPALPRTVEVLQCQSQSEYWWPVFVFGKMGDLGTPLLVERIGHADRNVRANALRVLGQWLLEPAAVRPLRDRYWKETDPDLRELLFTSITATATERHFTDYLKEVVAKEKDPKLLEAARNGLASFPKEKANIAALQKKKRPSASTFQKEYAMLYKSIGKKGSYETLEKASAPSDEPALKKLRERILQRNSEDASEDYRKVSKIIWLNRFFTDLK